MTDISIGDRLKSLVNNLTGRGQRKDDSTDIPQGNVVDSSPKIGEEITADMIVAEFEKSLSEALVIIQDSGMDPGKMTVLVNRHEGETFFEKAMNYLEYIGFDLFPLEKDPDEQYYPILAIYKTETGFKKARYIKTKNEDNVQQKSAVYTIFSHR